MPLSTEPLPVPASEAGKSVALSPKPLRILLISAARDRHARQLRTAFSALGVKVVTAALKEIGFDTASPSGLAIPGFDAGDLPDAVCVRTIDGGSFEAVTRRLGILHALSILGPIVSNDARSIENCVDKAATSFLLARAGLPSPRSWCVEKKAEAEKIVQANDAPLVLKPLFGAQGKGLKLIHTDQDLPEPDTIAGGVYYLQRFAGRLDAARWSDVRILVSCGRIVAAMRREAGCWITNISRGATGHALATDAELEDLAIAATAAVGGDFCGVDLLRDAAGRANVIEVNSMPAWTGLEKATGVDIAAVRAADLVARLSVRRPVNDRAGVTAIRPKAG